jgi:formamidopyrimidine-DNA glycosylase
VKQMPEGPECKHYANALNELLAGNAIYGIKIIAGRYTKAAPDGLAEDLFPIHIKSRRQRKVYIL